MRFILPFESRMLRPRHDGNRTNADVDPDVYANDMPIIDHAVCEQSGRSGAERCRELGLRAMEANFLP
jgi:hypothetical protein